MGSENIIFNYDFFIKSICVDMEPYVVDKNGVIGFLELKDPNHISLQKVKKTTADFLLEKCMRLSARNGRKYFTSDPALKDPKYLDFSRIKSFHQYFSNELPLFLDVNQFLKSMLLSSNQLFISANLKLCLSVMVDRFKIGHAWTAQEIIDACHDFADTSKFTVQNINTCLNTYCNGDSYFSGDTTKVRDISRQQQKTPYALFEKVVEGEDWKYILKLTELIAYYNSYLSVINKPDQKDDQNSDK